MRLWLDCVVNELHYSHEAIFAQGYKIRLGRFFHLQKQKAYNKRFVYYCMFKLKLAERLLKAAEESPDGIISLELLGSLRIADGNTLKTTLSRLAKNGRLLRLKRGVYCTNPMKDAFASAQAAFNGYVGFGSALYLHGMLTENPFTIIVVTRSTSKTKQFGNCELQAVAMGAKAAGSELAGRRFVSTRAKTLFDCLYLPRYAPEFEKLAEAYAQNPLSAREWKEFGSYCANMPQRAKKRLLEGKRSVLGRVKK
jgi:predicted transcriptional regulator of viral defense system